MTSRNRFKIYHDTWKSLYQGQDIFYEYMSFVRDLFKLDYETQETIMKKTLETLGENDENDDGFNGMTVFMCIVANWFIENDTYKCCLCKTEFVGMGNSPYPVSTLVGDRCCDKCSLLKVLPERFAYVQKEVIKHSNDTD